MIMELVFTFLFVIISLTHTAYGKDCRLTLNSDFSSQQPVFLQNGAFITPNSEDGQIWIQSSAPVLVACPGPRNFIVLGNQTLPYSAEEIKCKGNSNFSLGKWSGSMKDIKCATQPRFSVEDSGFKCHGDNTVYRVGYKVEETFYTQYEACFDESSLITLYVKHEVNPLCSFSQSGKGRPSFAEGEMFGKIRMNKLYKLEQQKERFNELLGEDMDKKYLTKNQFLTRGHLAARADFSLRTDQRTSFHYINAAPQWMRGNAGDWAALEEAIRRRMRTYDKPVTIYTGTYGVLFLEDKDGNMVKMYLAEDENNNRVVPVPLYNYKVVHDSINKTAVAFISINSSYYNASTINKLSFCEDICQGNAKFSWLKWRPKDGTHSFCCFYDDFVEKIQHLPELDVEDLFY